MSHPKIKGKISEYYKVEWTIENIFSYVEVNEIVFSRKFSFLDAGWRLELYPNGQTTFDSKGWMNLYLSRVDDLKSPKSVNFSFGIKKCDETVETPSKNESNNVFEKRGSSWGRPKWFRRSDLLARKSELAPSGNLTITCYIRTNASSVTTPVISGDHSSTHNPPVSQGVASSPVGTDSFQENASTTTGLQELSDDFMKMFLSRKGCDATLKVRNEEFPVNRGILASRSLVFEAMFEADMKEKNTGMVDIVDCHPKAFKDFLVFIYSGKFENSSGEIFELYSIAHKYDVERLKSECVAFIMENITAENVVDAYAIGHRFHEEKLKKKSQDFFDENVAEIISSDKWDSLLKEKLTMVNMLLKGMAQNTEIKKKRDKK